MSDQSAIETPRAGRVGPHRESHEPRLKARDFLAPGITPVKGFLEWNGAQGIGERWGMCNNGPDHTNPPWMPDGAGDCGLAMASHADMAKRGDLTLMGKFGFPKFATALDAYWAYGIAQGEAPPHPDFGVDNANLFAWAYKEGLIYGYAEVDDDEFDWFAQLFDGGCVGLTVDAQTMSDDFNASPRVPWDAFPGAQSGHDTLGIITHADGSGALVTWGAVQPYTLAFRQTNWTDRWVIFDENDPNVDHAKLQAALLAVHGVLPAQASATVPPVAEGFIKRAEADVTSIVDKVGEAIHFGGHEVAVVEEDAIREAKAKWTEMVTALEGLRNWTKDREQLHKLAATAIEGESVNLLITELQNLLVRFA